jgi:hypothetical protein
VPGTYYSKQNEQANSAAAKAGLNDAEKERFHDAISGQGYSYQDLLEIAKGIKSGTK